MIDGITVLATVRTLELPELVLFGGIALLMILAGIQIMIVGDKMLGTLFTLMGIGFFISAYLGYSETTHKVTIDDSVSFKEFSKYYTVVSVDGGLYTIKTKGGVK